MDPLTAFVAFVQAIPDLIELGKELITFLNQASGNDPQGYVQKVGAAMKSLNAAQTVEDRQNAAKLIADAIAGL